MVCHVLWSQLLGPIMGWHFWRFHAYLEVSYTIIDTRFGKRTQKFGVHKHKFTNKQKESTIFRCTNWLKHLRVKELRAYAFDHPLLPCCELIKTRRSVPLQFIGWLEQRMPRPSAKPATSRNQAAEFTVEETRKQPRELDSLTYWSQFTHTVHDAIISLFPAPHIRLLLISNPRPRRLLHDSLQN